MRAKPFLNYMYADCRQADTHTHARSLSWKVTFLTCYEHFIQFIKFCLWIWLNTNTLEWFCVWGRFFWMNSIEPCAFCGTWFHLEGHKRWEMQTLSKMDEDKCLSSVHMNACVFVCAAENGIHKENIWKCGIIKMFSRYLKWKYFFFTKSGVRKARWWVRFQFTPKLFHKINFDNLKK